MRPAQPAPLTISTVFGLLMCAAAMLHADSAGPLGAVLIASAAVAVLIGLRYLVAATLAVLLVLAALVISEPAPPLAALSGMSAAAYLVIRHAAGSGVVTTTRPTVIGMVGFALIGTIATMIPLSFPWLPLAAPLAVVAIFLLVTGPFVHDHRVTRAGLFDSGTGGDSTRFRS